MTTLRIIIVLFWLSACLGGKSPNARPLRGRRALTSNATDAGPVLFRITVVGTFIEGDNGTITKEEDEQVSAVPIVDGKETSGLFAVALPQRILDDNESAINAGNLFVSITLTSLHEEEIVLSPNSVVEVISDPRMTFRSTVHLTQGTKTLAIVRISTKDASPKDDAATLHDGLFSLDKINLRTQFRACSFGKLDWVPAPAGVVEVMVDQPVSDFKTGASLVTAAMNTLAEKHGIADASELGDKVVLCLPPGTGPWVASSGVNHWRAQFNNDWCLSLTATMHETGHMLGLSHSNENGVAYGDATGYMAAGNKAVHWPQKCFNGLENWKLGWYQGRQTSIKVEEGGTLIKIASFVDFERTSESEPVTVRIGELIYLQYNVAKEFNVDSEEKQNELTITAFSDTGSEGVAGLKEYEEYVIPNYEYSQRNLVIQTCRKIPGKLGAEAMIVSVALDASLCSQLHPDEVTPPPSLAPTVSPTIVPTLVPTAKPTANPTALPSVVPTVEPTLEPTKIPTVEPSHRPSTSPSIQPTIAKSNAPSMIPKVSSVMGRERSTSPPSPSPTFGPTRHTTPQPTMGSFLFWNLFANIKEGQPDEPPKIDYEALLKEREKKMKGNHDSFDPDDLGVDQDEDDNSEPVVEPVQDLFDP